MADKNYHIAKFYSRLYEIKAAIDNDLIPLAVHIGAHKADLKLFESLEILAADIEEHLKNHELSIS